MIDDILAQIQSKLEELESLRPIKPEFMKTISSKFKLDSNFHTNHIEGNTLTIGETNSLILHGLNSSIAKRGRDIEEMRGHIKVFDEIGFVTDKILTKDKLPLELTQHVIKNLHKVIFVEDEIKRSFHEGVTTVTTIPAGNYKTHSNSVVTSSGEMFEYADPSQVSSLISDLLEWYNKARKVLNPVVLASIFHYKFIRIHPFGDGNGRMARLLLNWILQSAGYSLVIVKSDKENRDSYLNSLSLADNNFIDINSVMEIVDLDSFEPFVQEIAKLELESLDIMIRGAKGEDITDVGDLIKELAFEARQKSSSNYSIDDVKKDKNLYELEYGQLKKITQTINQYIECVLKIKFHRVNYELTCNGHEISEEIEIEENDIWKFKIRLEGKKEDLVDSVNRFDEKFELRMEFILGNINTYLENGDFCAINYIDQELDNKLKTIIQNLDKTINQTKKGARVKL